MQSAKRTENYPRSTGRRVTKRKHRDRITRDQMENYLAVESLLVGLQHKMAKRVKRGAVVDAGPWVINDIPFEPPVPYVVASFEATIEAIDRFDREERKASRCR
jgi:hypothetical protein